MKPASQQFCQSCGMPMGETDQLYGSEANGAKRTDYCKYCYENGGFTFVGTMEELIEVCVGPMVQSNPGMTGEQARTMMQQFFPNLKRWKTK